MCPDCPARARVTNEPTTPCPNGITDPRLCFGDHACENLGEQAMIQAQAEKNHPPEVKNE